MENYEEERGQRIKIVALTAAAAVALIAVVALGIGLVLPKNVEPKKEGQATEQSQKSDKPSEANQQKSAEQDQNNTEKIEKAQELPETGPGMMMPAILVGGFIAGYGISRKLMKLEEQAELMDY